MAIHGWQLFPEDLSVGSGGGPGHRTAVTRTDSGFELRRATRTKPATGDLSDLSRETGTQEYEGATRLEFDVAKNIMDEAAYHRLLSFWHTVRGMAYGFRFWDPTDWSTHPDHASLPNPLNFFHYSAIHRQSQGGGERRYQLRKVYTDPTGASTFARKITRPMRLTVDSKAFLTVVTSPPVYSTVTGSPLLQGGIDVHVEHDVGTLRLDSSVATPVDFAVIYAAFTFHVPARFGTDTFPAFLEPEVNKRRVERLPIIEINPDRNRGDNERMPEGYSNVDYASRPEYIATQRHFVDPNDGIFQEFQPPVGDLELWMPDPTTGLKESWIQGPAGMLDPPTGGPYLRVWNNSPVGSGRNLKILQQASSLYIPGSAAFYQPDPPTTPAVTGVPIASLPNGLAPQETAELYLAQRWVETASPSGEFALWQAR